MKLWDKGVNVNKLVEEFTTGKDREYDLHLAAYDVLGSIAHVRMLQSIDLISFNDLTSLEGELKKLYWKIDKGEFIIEDDIEDVHSQVELTLTKALGDIGKKVHTARSRNDQVLLDIKLFTRDKIKEIVQQTNILFGILLDLSNKYKAILMPGYTHMQVAMPSSFGLWFGAYAESLTEDMILLNAAYKITNQNPLGSAAGFGSSFPVDRALTTKLLGFDSMHVNVVNAQMNRGKMERIVAFAIGSVGATLSKMAMDICTYTGQNFNFMKLPDEFTTGSSIMPHKKNPDVFELIRAKGNKLQALSYEISIISANLPSGYHRDLQLIKESFIPSFDLLLDMIYMTGLILDKITINPSIIDSDLYKNLFSVEEVNRLVLEGISFREAYRKVAEKIIKNKYNPDKTLDHNHEGSLGNLCNDIIKEKMDKILRDFDFDKIQVAYRNLLN